MLLRNLRFTLFALSLFWLIAAARPGAIQAASETPPPSYYYQFPDLRQRMADAADIPGNLLINGDMDDPTHRFYWRPTNHYVAGMWYEWWIGDTIPEFLDGGIPYHNVCYPVPANGRCYNNPYYNLSQGYILYNFNRYTAGVYQIVNNLTPCTLYTLNAYNTNEATGYVSKVGLEPTGWSLPVPSWDNPPYNCPPTGSSKCPDPRIASEASFPATLVWSPVSYEREWHPLNVTAEAANATMTAWLYAAVPAGQVSQSSYWDYASLVPAAFPDNRLPAPTSWTPSGFIQNLTAQWQLDTVLITWTTPEPASTQLWYTFAPGDDPSYERMTPLDTTPKTTHQVVVSGVQYGGDTVRFAALSRRPYGGGCTTEVATDALTIPERVPAPDSWTPSGFIQNLTTHWLLDKVLITWTTPEPAATQVWYTFAPGNDTLYPLATQLDTKPKTAHQVTLTAPQSGQPLRFAALSRHSQGEGYTTAVLTQTFVTPERVPAPASWTPSLLIQNLSITTGADQIQLTWKTTLSTTTQVWYNVISPPTPPPSHTIMLGHILYLPIVSNTGYHFSQHTVLSITPQKQHSAVINNLQAGENVRLVVVASYVGADQTITTVASDIHRVGPFQSARQHRTNFPESIKIE